MTAESSPIPVQDMSTTRVCIKNIPLSFTEAKLRQHLLSSTSTSSPTQLVITDCKLLNTKDGKTRRNLAFVGFQSADMASHVVQKFHKTYALTSRLIVEPAFSKKQQHIGADHDRPRPWSQHSQGSSRYNAKHEKEANDQQQQQPQPKGLNVKPQNTMETPLAASAPVESLDVIRRKKEFLAAMGGDKSSKPKFWANDDVMATTLAEPTTASADPLLDVDMHVETTEANVSDDDESTSQTDSNDSGGEGANVLRSKPTTGTTRHAPVVVSDMDFLRSKVTAVENLSDDSDSSSDDEEDNDDNHDQTQNTLETNNQDDSDDTSDSSSDSESDTNDKHSKVDPKDQTGTTDKAVTTKQPKDVSKEKDEEVEDRSNVTPNRLFVRNLPFVTTEDDLREHFAAFGTVTSCHIPIDDQKRNKGFAFITLDTSENATRAKTELDGTDFQGRLLHILPARRGIHDDMNGIDQSNLTYKQKQDLARQAEALGSTKGWSASFVRGDAVVDNLADRLGLNKGDILNVKDGLSSGDAAVRLALGETHIIEENRAYFRKHGVDMDALVSANADVANSGTKRSATSILVKNLPYDTELEELTKLFHGVGGDPPHRILLPPSRTIALVEYGHAMDARRAFRKLAYKRFKHVPVYLEWAPLSAKVVGDDATQNDGENHPVTTITKQATQAILKDADDDADVAGDVEGTAESGESYSIFVKNLNFTTTEEQLRQVFQKHVSSIRAVKIPRKAALIRGQSTDDTTKIKSLSMGFGFVECDSAESVRKAIQALQGTIVDGHALELKRSSKQIDESKQRVLVKNASGTNPTKLMVRNVPFQASRKEVLQLFGSFGQLKKVRLPKKFDGTHRGFAFVEYLTSKEAQTAMATLSRTHLYGRHLVLEWATDKDDMDTLRDKAKRDMDTQPAAPPKNKKIRFQ